MGKQEHRSIVENRGVSCVVMSVMEGFPRNHEDFCNGTHSIVHINCKIVF